MSLHVFANFVTPFGTAANNSAETEGNLATLQKLVWYGAIHSTVSAEAIRFALRRALAAAETQGTNRTWDDDSRRNAWRDDKFTAWASQQADSYIDDDLLGFMAAQGAKEEATPSSISVRRAVLEVTRAVSLTPWTGDVAFSVASPGATPAAQRKGLNPVPYGTEVHATRYQYGVAMTPERLRDRSRAAKAIAALCQLGPVAGNHSRFLFDFSPDAVVFRLTDDPAPRLLYCFDTDDDGRTFHAQPLLKRLKTGDIPASELIVGTTNVDSLFADSFRAVGVEVAGVKHAATLLGDRLQAELARGATAC